MACLVMGALQQASAGLSFRKQLVEVEAAADASTVAAEFHFTNRGELPVRIAQVDPDCTCIEVQVEGGKLVYQPGESGSMRALFSIGNSAGTVDQTVAVWLDDDPHDKPSVQLKVRIQVPELVSVKPKSLRWELGGPTTPQSIRVTMHHEKPIRITDLNCTSPDFELQLNPLDEGSAYEVQVTPKKVTRPSMGVIRIETDCPVEKQKLHQAFAMILRPQPKPSPEP